jgi:hypothetical protein
LWSTGSVAIDLLKVAHSRTPSNSLRFSPWMRRRSHACHKIDMRRKRAGKLVGRYSPTPAPQWLANRSLRNLTTGEWRAITTSRSGRLRAVAAGTALAATTLPCARQAWAEDEALVATATPMHVMVVVGENHTFDNLSAPTNRRRARRLPICSARGSCTRITRPA